MATMTIKKSLALPGTYEPNALYVIQDGSNQAVLYVANSLGTAVRALVSPVQQAQIDAIAAVNGSITTAASVAYSGFRNRIMNPQGIIDQYNQGTPVTVNSNSNIWCVDRWRTLTSAGANVRTGRSGNGTKASPSWIYAEILSPKAVVASSDQFRITQSIEGLNIADLNSGYSNSETVIITFKTCHSVAGKYCLALYNNLTNRSYVATYIQDVANATEEKSITVKLDTTGTWETGTNLGIAVAFDYGTGSLYQTTNANVWQAGIYLRTPDSVSLASINGAVLRITDVQFAIAGTSPKLEVRPISVEIELCQRYYERIVQDQIGAFNDTNAPTNDAISVPVYWKVRKRITPTVTVQLGVIARVGTDGLTCYQQGTPARSWYFPGVITAFADF